MDEPARQHDSSAPPAASRRVWWWSGAGLAWIVASCLVGSSAGMGAFTFYYANGGSYFSADPKACVNCHIMQGQFDAWEKSSHRHVAACNDCHAPHDGFLSKWVCKGRNGFFHSLAFTTGRHPDPIRITAYNRGITEQACRHCHAEVVGMIDTHGLGAGHAQRPDEELSCIRCHADVGHWTH